MSMETLRNGAGLLLGAAIGGACMVGMIAAWPALCAAACHGLWVTLAALLGMCASITPTIGLESLTTGLALALGVSLVTTPLMSVLYMGLAHLMAAISGVGIASGFAAFNAIGCVGTVAITGFLSREVFPYVASYLIGPTPCG